MTSIDIPSAVRAVLKRGGEHDRRRLKSIVLGAGTALASKAVGSLVALLSVPLTIGYLGREQYGVWVLLSSVLAWLALADFGIGNGLTNSVTSAIGKDRPDLARNHVSTALILLTLIALGVGAVVAVVFRFIDWGYVLGARSPAVQREVQAVAAASIAIFLAKFPLTAIPPTYNALQEGRIANAWGIVSNLATLLALILVTRTHGGLIWLVIAVSGTGLLVSFFSAVWLFVRRHPEIAPHLGAVRRESARSLLHIGVAFFLIQIVALAVFQTDNLVIAHFLGAAAVPTYSVTYSLFAYTSILQTTAFSYVWVAYADAIARRDIGWVRRAFRLNLLLSLGFTAAAATPLVFVAIPFIRFWTHGAVTPPFHLVLWMAAWSLINAFCSPIASLLAAAGHLRNQLVYASISAVANLTMSIYLVPIWGVEGAIAGTVMAYAVLMCAPTFIDVTLLLRRLSHDA